VVACGLRTLVIAGGVSANRHLRAQLDIHASRQGIRVHCPEPALCTDNGAMIAFAGALRLQAEAVGAQQDMTGTHPAVTGFDVRPRWPLSTLPRPGVHRAAN
jgi:N6-L-threonylcarbamoyladenine synthase